MDREIWRIEFDKICEGWLVVRISDYHKPKWMSDKMHVDNIEITKKFKTIFKNEYDAEKVTNDLNRIYIAAGWL